MKNIGFIIISAGILFSAFFTSCQKDGTGASNVTISFSNQLAKDSVYTNEDFTLKGAVAAEGQIKTIQFFRNYFFNDVESEVEMAGTKISDVTENPYSFSVVVPNVTKNTTVKVLVTDINGNEVSSVYTIKERKMNILTYSGLTLGGWDSDYGSCLDVDAGVPYGSGALHDDAKRPLIDVFFDEAKLANTDLDSIYYDNVSRLPDTGIRYATTTISSTDFDAMKGDDMFKNMVATKKIIDIKLNDVVFFKAKSGKKGLLRVSQLTSPTGDLLLDEKIQK